MHSVFLIEWIFNFCIFQKKLVHSEDPFNDEQRERHEVEMLAKKFEAKYVSYCNKYKYLIVITYDAVEMLKHQVFSLNCVANVVSNGFCTFCSWLS